MKKVLIVDDNKENQYMLEVLLSSSGFSVLTSSNGAEALEKAEREAPDLVVSDILMPVMDGYALCKKWRAHDRFKNIPFVFYTATYTDPQDEKFALSLGADRFLIKPTETEELVKIIISIMEEGRDKKISIPADQSNDHTYYKQYSETLVRKLEQKMFQLESINNALNEEIRVRKKAEELLRISLEEKISLLRELYHRTGNSMQLISSLLGVKLNYSTGKDLGAFVADMQNKIGAIAMVHQKLYNAHNLSSISLGEYIHDLCGSLAVTGTSSKKTVNFECDIEDTNINIEMAVPFGLILNELTLNSLKHAFAGNDTGLIKISLHHGAGEYIDFSYSDNGSGLPDGFDVKNNARMGFTIINLLVHEQLNGTMDIIRGKGFHCLIRFINPVIAQSN